MLIALRIAGVLVLCATLPAIAAPHDRLTIGLSESIGDFNPFFSNALVTIHVQAAARRSMTITKPDGSITCRFCTEVPSLENGRAEIVDLGGGARGMTVRYTLKPGLKWGDGAPMTARDYAFAFKVGQSKLLALPARDWRHCFV